MLLAVYGNISLSRFFPKNAQRVKIYIENYSNSMKFSNEIMLFDKKLVAVKKIEHQDKSILTVYFDFWIFPDFDAKKKENEYIVHSYSLTVCFCQASRKNKPIRFWRRKTFCDQDKTLLEAFLQFQISGTLEERISTFFFGHSNTSWRLLIDTLMEELQPVFAKCEKFE